MMMKQVTSLGDSFGGGSPRQEATARALTDDLETAFASPSVAECREIEVEAVRTDGKTQHRRRIVRDTVIRYAELMESGVEFPPIAVWFDGTSYWLSDGYHRLAATKLNCNSTIRAIIRLGELSDACWDSYRANSDHGLTRTKCEIATIICQALNHPKASLLSNVEIAKHLNISEATLRRWRKRLDIPGNPEAVRLVRRGASAYMVNTTRIGQGSLEASDRRPHVVRYGELREGLAQMGQSASPDVRRLLNVLAKWLSGLVDPLHCLSLIERIVTNLRTEK